MPKECLPPYQCPRCGYETRQKPSIRDHLYSKKKACPGVRDTLDLTDDIKEHILTHRIYRKPDNRKQEDKAKVIINNYNQYNNINNIIAGMDAVDKLTHYMSFKGQELLDFESTIENKYKKTVKQLDKDTTNTFLLKEDKLLEIVGRASEPEDDSTHNVIYDNKLKELKIYDGTWEAMSLDAGTKHYMERIQRNFLDAYERYLLRNIKNARQAQDKALFKEMLERYFAFIGCFDLDPYCRYANDEEIINPVSRSDEDDDGYDDCDDEDAASRNGLETDSIMRIAMRPSPESSLSEEFYPFYKTVLKSLTRTFVNRTIRSVQDMLKRNSARSVMDLNKKITKLFHMDETFRDLLLSIQH